MSDKLEQAAIWFAARRRAVQTLTERTAQDEWLRDPDNAFNLAELERTWNALDGLKETLTADARGAAKGASETRPARKAIFAAACAVTLAFGMMSYGGNSSFWTALDWSNR